jgi:hypothetical protein
VERIESRMLLILDQQAMPDADPAEVYGVPT